MMPEEKEILPPGTVMEGRYLLGKMIRRDDESIIYRGYDKVLEQYVFLRQKCSATEEERFRQKAKWFAFFENKKNVIDIYRYEVLSGMSFMVQEYVDGVVGISEVPESAVSGSIQMKKEDILCGKDGIYHILDFQISFDYCVIRHEEKKEEIRIDDDGENREPLSYGTRIKEQYKIIRTLGMGGFGITYLALDTILNRFVAIKEYMPSNWVKRESSDGCVEVLSSSVLEEYKRGLRRFREEAACMAVFQSNPGVAKVYDFVSEWESAYLIMEYVEGENVGKFGKLIGGFRYEAAKDIFLKVLYIIESIHENGLIHGDISPGNIILTGKNEVKLIDFGSAHAPGKAPYMLSEMMLKPGYAAIEQYDEEYREDERTDIYQAAATFYMLITGERPQEANERWKKDELLLPSELGIEMPPEEEQALKRALTVNPEQRMRTVREWIDVLEFSHI